MVTEIEVSANLTGRAVRVSIVPEDGNVLRFEVNPRDALDLARALQNAARLLKVLECAGN